MTTRLESRFGEVASLGTAYTSLGTVPSTTTWNILMNITNRTAGLAKLRAYVADTSWSSGEPTGGTLKAAIAYDVSVNAGSTIQISGIVVLTTEKVIVRSDTASSLDILLNGVAITP